MKKLLLSIVCLGACCLLLLSSCSETTSPDPCSGAHPVTARFTVHEVLDRKTAPSTDTVITGNIIFAADERYDSYEWHIGYDNRVWTDSTVQLHFEEAVGDVPVTLIVKRAPQKACFPNDDGIDTLKRNINVIGGWEKTRVLGKYHGYNTDNPKDTFTFTLEYRDIPKLGRHLVLNNLNRGCKEPPDPVGSEVFSPQIDISVGYRSFEFYTPDWSGNGCEVPQGVAVLQGDGDSVEVKYSVIDRNDIWKRIPKTFVGRRVQ